MHKTVLLASSALVSMFVAQSAFAAEWTGFYIGLHVGGATGDIDWTNVTEATGYIDLDTGDSLGVSPEGVLGGAQLGYNYNMSNWLFGIEGTFSALDFDETAANPFAPVDDEFIQSDIEWLGTAAARLGFTFGDTLLYGKGGWAVAEVNTYHEDHDGGRQGFYSTSETHNGWVAGAGIEHAIAQDVSVALEYNYIDLGEQEHSGIATTGFGGLVANDVDTQIHTGTLRLNWHFNPL
jgi:outer membrane immunogenic protein